MRMLACFYAFGGHQVTLTEFIFWRRHKKCIVQLFCQKEMEKWISRGQYGKKEESFETQLIMYTYKNRTIQCLMCADVEIYRFIVLIVSILHFALMYYSKAFRWRLRAWEE